MNSWSMFKLRGLAAIWSSAFLLSACSGSFGSPGNGLAALPAAHRVPAGAAAKSGYKQLYVFQGTPDGASPYSGLIADGSLLYGTTLNGSSNYCSQSCGSNNCYLGCGTVFSVDGSGNEKVVYNFKGNFSGGRDGSWPFAGLTDLSGTLYGTASGAGKYGHGVVYTVAPSGSESVLYSFSGNASGGSDGEVPEAALTAYENRLFGTTVYGGGSGCGGAGCGTAYWLSTTGNETVLYRFKGGRDGNRVYAGLTPMHGKLYGATLLGGGAGCGSLGCGTIFELNSTGKERVLYRFTGSSDGAYPNGLVAVKGLLYGTTEGGGSKNSGTFFSITRSGKLTTLYDFQDIPDGNLPGANLIYHAGNFYGTTVGGGTAGDGTVFEVSPSGTESALYSFQAGSDGSDPQGPLYDFKGALYGTTTKGGGAGCGGSGCGTIFKVKP